MEPWSFDMDGTKTELLAAVKASAIPDSVKQATALLFDLLPDIPGYTDEEPSVTWQREVEKHPEKYSALDKPPPPRDSYLKRYWHLALAGHPDAFGVSIIRIDPIHQMVK